ncbi:MAG: hypothetical protein DWQ01_20965 [Planctomycetota bacterium]|nr:MAG: hypothetical protein DWQ01_20965 [Planctomycetota bacterium]
MKNPSTPSFGDRFEDRPSSLRSEEAWNRQLHAWFDGEVSDWEADEIRSQLLQDPSYRTKLAELRNLRQDLDLLQAEGPDAATLDRMSRRFEAGLAREVRSLTRGLQLWRRAAAVLLLLSLTLFAADRALLPGTVQANQKEEIDRLYLELLQQAETSPSSPESPTSWRPPGPGPDSQPAASTEPSSSRSGRLSEQR